MKKTPLLLTILIVAALTLSACGSNASLKDTTWKLVSYGKSASDQTPAVADINANVTFGADGQVNGNMGCNSFSGSYELKGDKIVFGPIMSTMMACQGPGMDQEAAAFNVLHDTVTASLNGSTLTLTGPDGGVLVLELQQ